MGRTVRWGRWSPGQLALAALLCACAACSSPEERTAEARAAVRDALARRDRDTALRELEALRGAGGGTPEEILDLASLLVQAGEAGQAVWLLEQAVARHAGRDELRVALARAALLTENPELARRAVEPVQPASASHGDALLLRAQSELGLGRLEEGLTLLRDAIGLYPDRAEPRLLLVQTLVQERRTEEARATVGEAKEALDLAGSEQDALRARLELVEAQLDAAEGKSDAAVARLRKRVEWQRHDLAAWGALAQILGREGRGAEALDLVDAALAADGASPELARLRAGLLAGLGRREEARAAVRDYLARANAVEAYLQLPALVGLVGDDAAFLAMIEEGAARFPDARELAQVRAELLIGLDRVDEAEAIVRELAEERREPAVEYLGARIQLARGDARGAARRLERLAPHFDRAGTQFWLGQALEALGDTQGAALRYGAAARLDPSSLGPPLALIRLLARRGDWAGVAAQAQILARRAPGNTEAWLLLGDALVQLADAERAEQVARAVLKQFPDRPEPHWLLAAALRLRGDTKGALAALAAARERFGPSPELEAERGLALGMGGRGGEALAVVDAALAEHPDVARLHAVRGGLLFQLGRGEEGARAAERALELDPDDLGPLRSRVDFRASTGDWAGTRTDAERYLAARPEDAHVHFALGLARAGLGDTAGAEQAYRRAAELDERAAAPRNNLAMLLARRGDVEAATRVAQEAYAVAAQDPVVLDTLGWLYLRQDLTTRAIGMLEQAHAKAPALPDAQLHLAQAYAAAGRRDEARKLLAALSTRTPAAHPLRPEIDEALRAVQ